MTKNKGSEEMKDKEMILTHEENQVAHVFKRGGYPAGNFIRALIEAIIYADTPNSIKLHNEFPEYVDAVKGYQTGHTMNGEPSDFLDRLRTVKK